jgi:DNA (cytosine-5)-methyltransferase 1
MHDIAPCLTKADQHGVAQPIPLDMMNIRGRPSDDGRANRIGRGYGEVGDPMFTITKANHHGVAQPIGVDTYNGAETGQVSCTITADVGGPTHSGPKVLQSMAVRRLTPKECERLQGFGDNYTDIQAKGKPTPDGPRYKAWGNSMAVPVMRWIGERIKKYEEMA